MEHSLQQMYESSAEKSSNKAKGTGSEEKNAFYEGLHKALGHDSMDVQLKLYSHAECKKRPEYCNTNIEWRPDILLEGGKEQHCENLPRFYG